MSRVTGRVSVIVLAAVVATGATSAPADTGAPLRTVEGPWVDQHRNYPAVPNGLSQIKSIFGAPCNTSANANAVFFKASDNGQYYRVNYHAKLGGASSSNLDNDVAGHINAAGLRLYSGIWGYACRTKRNSNQYSTHAWGIAVDINSAYETPGSSCNTVTEEIGKIWTGHNWSWGAAWKDCMHFQYATGY